MAVTISKLNNRESKAHDALIDLAGLFGKLPQASKDNVMHRWEMLHLINKDEKELFLQWLARINKEG